MAFVKHLFDKNFIEYASYVIRDRAIPDLEDGLKPVQRRILHTLFEMDDGRFQKVANVVGQTMRYHPHGDASIYGAVVTMANRGLYLQQSPRRRWVSIFLETQGNFGNMFTGDSASAGRYIECRINPLAKEFFVTNPHVTHYIPNYDGRGTEPEVFRAKIPVALIIGAEGIAVGMSTKILPYNIREVLDAEIKFLRGEPFTLYPDVPTGGLIDVSGYNDGNGKIITRAKFDTSDEKKIVITELPLDTTSEALLNSIDGAYRAGKIKISAVDDHSTDHCEIEIRLPRGVYARDVIDSLYAYTDCEKSISCQMLVIKDNMPVAMTASEIIAFYAQRLTLIIKDELEFERGQLTDRLHLRTLERIFIEERIYKRIEEMKTQPAVLKAVADGFVPFRDELVRPLSKEDIDHLLGIPIRRISLYDISKNRAEVRDINARLKDIARKLKNLTACAVDYLGAMLGKFGADDLKRRTQVVQFSAVDVKEVAKSDRSLRYDEKYLGIGVSGGREIRKVSPYDRILYVRRNGMYAVIDVPEKMFINKDLCFCEVADKETIAAVLFTVIFRDPATKVASIKRCRIPGWIMNRDYFLAPDGMEVLHVSTAERFSFMLHYEHKAKAKILKESFRAEDFAEKGLKTLGVRLSARACERLETDDVPDARLFAQG
ncbi:MAG: DNA topoisomerase IV subunit A [Treponemataceae bacterium]|nr:DNA topoisomerase IV subunit A [Treponemataceae bacterium]